MSLMGFVHLAYDKVAAKLNGTASASYPVKEIIPNVPNKRIQRVLGNEGILFKLSPVSSCEEQLEDVRSEKDNELSMYEFKFSMVVESKSCKLLV